MSIYPQITSIESVKEWWEENSIGDKGESYPRWNLYSGHLSRFSNQYVIYKQEDETISLEESWDKLEKMIVGINGGSGKFTLVVQNKGTNRGASQFLTLGSALNGSSASISGTGASIAGFDKILDLTERTIRLEMENESLRAELDDPNNKTFRDLMIGIAEQLTPAIPQLIGAILGAQSAKKGNGFNSQSTQNNRSIEGPADVDKKALDLINSLRNSGKTDEEISDLIDFISTQSENI